jgi:hypothetical protein
MESRAGNQAVVGIGVVQRRQQPVIVDHFVVACRFRSDLVRRCGFECGVAARCRKRQVVSACHAGEHAQRPAVLRHYGDLARAGTVFELNESQDAPLLSCFRDRFACDANVTTNPRLLRVSAVERLCLPTYTATCIREQT